MENMKRDGKQWVMFGRGVRGELDDEEGVEMARRLREAVRIVRGEVREMGRL